MIGFFRTTATLSDLGDDDSVRFRSVFAAAPCSHVPKRWHLANGTMTLIRGTLIVERNDTGNKAELDTGSFAYILAKIVHQASTNPEEDELYFITVDGQLGYPLRRASRNC